MDYENNLLWEAAQRTRIARHRTIHIIVIVNLQCPTREFPPITLNYELAVLAQMVACLPLVQQVRSSIPGGVVNFNLKIFNLGARRGGDVHFLIANCTSQSWIKFQTIPQYVC